MIVKSPDTPSGSEDYRTQRLERMRESQRKLRSQRRNELTETKKINEELKRQNEQLNAKNEQLQTDFGFLVDMLNEEITSKQLEMLVTDVDKDFTCGYKEDELMTMDEFIEACNFANVGVLYLGAEKDKFILDDICEKSWTCMNKAFKNNIGMPLKSTPFRFLKFYGLDVVRTHLDSLRALSAGKVPRCWLNNNTTLPPGAMGMVEVLRYITNMPPETFVNLNTFILSSFIARNSFATKNGFAMFKHDVTSSIEAANTPGYDSEFLLGTLDLNLCPAGSPPPKSVTSFPV